METATNRRPWETNPSPSQLQTQTLPSISTLTRDVDSRPDNKNKPLSASSAGLTPRDSAGSWTGTTGLLSGSSSQSANTMPYLNSSTNHSPSQRSQPYTPDGPNHPTSGLSSTRNSGAPLNFDHNRGSGDFEDSRRESVDSRMHQGMDNLRLGGPTSPYNASANASQSSLASSLQQQRGINGFRDSRGSTGGPISPLWPRNGSTRGFGAGVAPRIAPPIMENPRSEGMYAAEPVRGQPWAFPDTDARPDRPESTVSRRNSYASSFTNASIYSERPLPPGQHELPDHHHHTSMPAHERIQHLREDPDSPNSTTPYSRTPELRVTHKLAERKRRSEMKDCFEQLRQKLPANQNNKSSKWETLARAIDYISQLEGQNKQSRMELDRQRNQMHEMEIQIKELSQRLGHQSGGYSAPPPPNAMPTSPLAYNNPHYSNGHDSSKEPSRTLPPIMNGGAMQGVQYGENR